MSPRDSLHVVQDRDTMPPSCPPPTLCPGLEALVIDMGVLRADVERIQANQTLQINEQRRTNSLLAELLAKG
jgi:hypothetical protein